MAPVKAATQKQNRAKANAGPQTYDRELEALSPDQRWREWMLRVEAVIFASSEPVSREMLTRVIGQNCSVDLLVDDINAELDDRPFEIVTVAGGWQHRTRARFGETIRAAQAPTRAPGSALSELEAMVLITIGYFQPVTRVGLSKIIGKEVSRDTIASLRAAGFIGAGPRSPTPGAPYTYVTTRHFLSAFGMQTLRDLPDIEALEEAGLLSRAAVDREQIIETGQIADDFDEP